MAVKHKFWFGKRNYEATEVNNVCLNDSVERLIDYFQFYIPLNFFSHISVMETPSLLVWLQYFVLECLNYHSEPLSRKGFSLCHTCCDTGPRFFPKDHLIQLHLTTHTSRMW
jgi:hypothetical protein